MTDNPYEPEAVPTTIEIFEQELKEKDSIIDEYIRKNNSLKRINTLKAIEYDRLLKSNEDLIDELQLQLKRSSTLIENYELQINKLMGELDD